MKRRMLFTALLAVLAITTNAQVSFDVETVDKKRVVRGTESFQKTDNEIFANVVLWAINQGPSLKEEIVDCDFVKRELNMNYNLKKEDAIAYACRLKIKVAQGKLVFLVSDVKMQGGLLGAFLNFDKLNPEKKTKHQDIINEFRSLNNQKIQEMFSYISEHNPVITNWNNVCVNKIDKGMSCDEAMLVYGKPLSIQSDGTKEQYMFSSFVYVYIENGLVISFVN